MLWNKLDLPKTDEPVCKMYDYFKNIKLSEYQKISFDIATVKAEIKISKSKKEKRCAVKLLDSFFNAQYLIDVCDILGGEVSLYIPNDGKLIPAYLESENGNALLFPVRGKDNKGETIVHKEIECNAI